MLLSLPTIWSLSRVREGLRGALSLLFAMWAESWVQCTESTMPPKRRWTDPLAADETSHLLLVVSTRYDHDTNTPLKRNFKDYAAYLSLIQHL
ncbi:hypothetical protein C8Q80DRAFT_1265689 [Daedaleopsis nitida]|nr:hypothetical protein C8Q80DRAFT_1265689 [Daedaleopsis nitida]